MLSPLSPCRPVGQSPSLRAFSPLSINGLQLWLDASQVSGADGDPVTTWGDLSGNGRNATQSTTAAKPTLKTAVQNGRSALLFDGTDDSIATAAAVFTGAAARTVVAIYRDTKGGAHVSPICGQSTGSSGSTWFVLQSRNSGAVGDPYLAGFANDLTGPAVDGLWKVAVVTYDGATATTYKNGAQANTGAKTYNTVNQPFAIGADASSFLGGYVGEIAVYNTALSAADRQRIERYLGAKWGIAVS